MNSIAIYSDLICPWCYIGKRRMEAALRQPPAVGPVSLSWHPFQLNPELPREGQDRRAYRSAKFGSWQQSQALDAQVVAMGKTVGIEYRYDLQLNTPNTFDSHRLVWFAGVHGVQDAVVEALFRGYFCEGVNLSERKNLAKVAAAAGLDAAEVERFLASEAGAAEVRHEEQCARTLGISGVPFYVINKAVAFSGAQRPETFLEALRRSQTPANEASYARADEKAGDGGTDGRAVPQ